MINNLTTTNFEQIISCPENELYSAEAHQVVEDKASTLYEAIQPISEEIQILERWDGKGILSFDPSKLKPLISHLTEAVPKVLHREAKIDTLQENFLDLIAIEDIVQSYLTVAKKIKEFESPSVFSELIHAVRHPLETLFPSLEQQKNHWQEKFCNKARSFHTLLIEFQIQAKIDF